MRRILALLLALALAGTLGGCGFVFPATYSAVTAYEEQNREEADSSILRAENYTELLNSVQYFVSQGVSKGVVRLYQYDGDVELDLYNACQEVQMEDPIGTYALEEIDYDYQQIVTYYECVITCTYRRTAEQIAAIRRVNGTAAIRTAIEETICSREEELVLEISTYTANETLLRSLVDEAYLENPVYAVEEPVVTVTVYPSNGSSNVVELLFSWSDTAEALNRKVDAVRQDASAVISEAGVNGRVSLARLYTLLRARMSYSADGAGNVAAFFEGELVNSRGAALAVQLTCSLSGISSQIVSGTMDGAAHWWNLVTLEDGTSAYLDLTQTFSAPAEEGSGNTAGDTVGGATEDYLLSDEIFAAHYSLDTGAAQD